VGEAVDGSRRRFSTGCMDTTESGPAVSGIVVRTAPVLRLAVAAYLARFKGQSRVHTESDLRGYLIWCEERGLDPLAATRPRIELYVRLSSSPARGSGDVRGPRARQLDRLRRAAAQGVGPPLEAEGPHPVTEDSALCKS
jgi:hypothetical protein